MRTDSYSAPFMKWWTRSRTWKAGDPTTSVAPISTQCKAACHRAFEAGQRYQRRRHWLQQNEPNPASRLAAEKKTITKVSLKRYLLLHDIFGEAAYSQSDDIAALHGRLCTIQDKANEGLLVTEVSLSHPIFDK